MTTTRSGSRSRVQAVVPLLINQILSCKQQDFRLHGKPVHIACLVGIIKNIQINSNETILIIEDHTAWIKGVLRVETDAEMSSKLSNIKENGYAQVFGVIRIESSERVFVILKMFAVDDMNVLTSHALQALCSKLEAAAELKTQISAANTCGAALADAATSEPVDVRPRAPKFTQFQHLIFNIIKSEDSQYGISKRAILQQFPAYQGHEVNETLHYLINEGHIYPTIDQEHFKAIVHD